MDDKDMVAVVVGVLEGDAPVDAEGVTEAEFEGVNDGV